MPNPIELSRPQPVQMTADGTLIAEGNQILPNPRTAIHDPLNTGGGVTNSSPVPYSIADELPSQEKLRTAEDDEWSLRADNSACSIQNGKDCEACQ